MFFNKSNSEQQIREYEKVCDNIKAISGILRKKYNAEKTIRLINVLIPGARKSIEDSYYKVIENKILKNETVYSGQIEEIKEIHLTAFISKWILENKEKCLDFKRHLKKKDAEVSSSIIDSYF